MYDEDLKNLVKQIAQTVSLLNNSKLAADQKQALVSRMQTLQSAINEQVDFDFYSPEMYRELNDALNDCKKEFKSFFDGPNSKKDKTATKALISLSKEINGKNKSLNACIEGLKNSGEFINNYIDGKEEGNIKNQAGEIGTNGKAPSMLEIANMSFLRKPQDPDFYKNLQWLAMNDYKAKRMRGQDANNSFYSKKLMQLSYELDEAPLDVQAEFASWSTRQQSLVFDRAMDTYDFLKEKSQIERTEEPQTMLEFSRSDAYNSAVAMSAFLNDFYGQSRVGTIKKGWDKTMDVAKGKDFEHRRSIKFVQPLVSGDMTKYLSKHKLTNGDPQRVQAHEIKRNESFVANEYLLSDKLEKLLPEYNKLVKDTKGKSASCQAMMDSVKDLLSADISGKDYDAKLKKAMDASKAYLDSHATPRKTDNGKKRVDIANNLYSTLSEIHKSRSNETLYDIHVNASEDETRSLGLAGLEGIRRGLSEDQIAQIFTNKEYEANVDVQQRVRAAQQRNPGVIDDLSIELDQGDDYARNRREAIHKLAKGQYAKACTIIESLDRNIELAKQYGEVNEHNKKLLEDRDFRFFMFDQGNDPETYKKNLDTLSVFTPKKSQTPQEFQKAQADVFNERMKKIVSKNYDQYLDLSDEEAIQKLPDICKDMFVLGVTKDCIRNFVSQNEYADKDLMKQCIALGNKYSNVYVPYLERAKIMSNPYYLKYDIEKLNELSYNDSNDITSSIGDEDCLLNGQRTQNDELAAKELSFKRFLNAYEGFRQFGVRELSDRITSEVCPDPSDNEAWMGVKMFDKSGNPIAGPDDVMDAAKSSGGVYAMYKNDMSTLKAFDLTGNRLEYKEAQKDTSVTEKIKQQIIKEMTPAERFKASKDKCVDDIIESIKAGNTDEIANATTSYMFLVAGEIVGQKAERTQNYDLKSMLLDSRVQKTAACCMRESVGKYVELIGKDNLATMSEAPDFEKQLWNGFEKYQKELNPKFIDKNTLDVMEASMRAEAKNQGPETEKAVDNFVSRYREATHKERPVLEKQTEIQPPRKNA